LAKWKTAGERKKRGESKREDPVRLSKIKREVSWWKLPSGVFVKERTQPVRKVENITDQLRFYGHPKKKARETWGGGGREECKIID